MSNKPKETVLDDTCMTWYRNRERELDSEESYDEYVGREPTYWEEEDGT